jgi:uncharacterized membrane protein YccC
MQSGTVLILGSRTIPCQELALRMPECQLVGQTGHTAGELDNIYGNSQGDLAAAHCSSGQIGVAGVVSIVAAGLLRLPQGYWAAISAFVVMGTDVGTTIPASRDRLIGTGIGAVLGAVFATFWGVHLVSFGIAVAATALVCESLGFGQNYRMACVTVAIVMLIKTPVSPWKASTHRFLEVALGIVVALVISALPPKSVGNP